MAEKHAQTEMEDIAPNSPIRKKILEAIALQDEIGEKANELREVMDDLRKMMRDEKKKHLNVEDAEGKPRSVNLVSTGERIKIGKAPKAKEKTKKEEGAE